MLSNLVINLFLLQTHSNSESGKFNHESTRMNTEFQRKNAKEPGRRVQILTADGRR